MSDGESTVIAVRETLSVDVIKDKGITVRLLDADSTGYLVQLPYDETSGLAEMITVALTTEKAQH